MKRLALFLLACGAGFAQQYSGNQFTALPRPGAAAGSIRWTDKANGGHYITISGPDSLSSDIALKFGNLSIGTGGAICVDSSGVVSIGVCTASSVNGLFGAGHYSNVMPLVSGHQVCDNVNEGAHDCSYGWPFKGTSGVGEVQPPYVSVKSPATLYVAAGTSASPITGGYSLASFIHYADGQPRDGSQGAVKIFESRTNGTAGGLAIAAMSQTPGYYSIGLQVHTVAAAGTSGSHSTTFPLWTSCHVYSPYDMCSNEINVMNVSTVNPNGDGEYAGESPFLNAMALIGSYGVLDGDPTSTNRELSSALYIGVQDTTNGKWHRGIDFQQGSIKNYAVVLPNGDSGGIFIRNAPDSAKIPVLWVDSSNDTHIGAGTAQRVLVNRPITASGYVGSSVSGTAFSVEVSGQADAQMHFKNLDTGGKDWAFDSTSSASGIGGGRFWLVNATDTEFLWFTDAATHTFHMDGDIETGPTGWGGWGTTNAVMQSDGLIWSKVGGFKFPDNTTQTTAGLTTIIPTVPYWDWVNSAVFQFSRDDSTLFALDTQSDISTAQPAMVFRRARGSHTSPTPIEAGDFMGSVVTRGFDGAAFGASSAGFRFVATDNFSTTAHGTKIGFYSTASGSTAFDWRAYITENGIEPGSSTMSLGTTGNKWSTVHVGTLYADACVGTGCGGGGTAGVTTLYAVSPIQVSANFGSVTVSCPTCSSGATYYPLTGGFLNGTALPGVDNIYNLGAFNYRWAQIYGYSGYFNSASITSLSVGSFSAPIYMTAGAQMPTGSGYSPTMICSPSGGRPAGWFWYDGGTIYICNGAGGYVSK